MARWADVGFSMPVWGQVMVAVAALVGGARVIWTQLLRPAARLMATAENMAPVLVEFTEVFGGHGESLRTLQAIAAEYTGSSLREVVGRLELAALENHHASERLKTAVDMSRLLAERDREAVQQLIVLLERLTIRAQRLEDERAGVSGPPPRPTDLLIVRAPAPGPPNETSGSADAAVRALWDGLERRVGQDPNYRGPERRDPTAGP